MRRCTNRTDLGRRRKRVSAFRCVVRSRRPRPQPIFRLLWLLTTVHKVSPPSHRTWIANLWTSSPPHPTLSLRFFLEVTCTIPPQLFSRTYTQLGLLVTAAAAQESHRANLPLLCSRDRLVATGYSASATQRFWSI